MYEMCCMKFLLSECRTVSVHVVNSPLSSFLQPFLVFMRVYYTVFNYVDETIGFAKAVP